MQPSLDDLRIIHTSEFSVTRNAPSRIPVQDLASLGTQGLQ